METTTIERLLGIDPGETLPALARLARDVAPHAPAEAFERLWLLLPWLGGAMTADDVRAQHGSVEGVLPFAITGGDFGYYGFLMDDDRPTDARPIVCVQPRDPEETAVVAPDIRAFLGLMSLRPGDRISRSWTDADWKDRPARFEDGWLDGWRRSRLARRLRTLPGVTRPASPSAVTRAAPTRAFTIVGAPPPLIPADLAEHFARMVAPAPPTPFELARKVHREVGEHAKRGEHRDAAEKAEAALDNRHGRAQLLAEAARARAALGQRDEAQRWLRALVDEWLDESPAPPPFPHPRACVGRDDVLALLDLVAPPDAAALHAKVRRAGPPPEHADFF